MLRKTVCEMELAMARMREYPRTIATSLMLGIRHHAAHSSPAGEVKPSRGKSLPSAQLESVLPSCSRNLFQLDFAANILTQ